jgi:hypothetical protein
MFAASAGLMEVSGCEDPAVRARFLDVGAEPIAMPTDDSSRFLHGEIAKWRDVITKAGIPK